MAKDIRQTRREKVVVRLLENNGEQRLDELHEWASVKLLCAHQAFSELMEGMTEDGLVRWDGTTFSLHSEGRALAIRVIESAGKTVEEVEGKGRAAEADAGGHDHDHDHGGGHDHGHDHGGGHDHGHDHGGGHDHGHDHGGGAASGVQGGRADRRDARYGTGEEMDMPKPASRPARPAPPPPPPTSAPPSGLRARLKSAIKGLLGRR